jgi:hypothetical protein
MNPGEKYWTVVESVWDTISIYDGGKTFLTQYEDAPVIARHLFAAHWCQSEVRNGGLRQFFTSSSGVLAPEAIEAFKIIGMLVLSDVVKEGAETFGPVYPRAKSARAKLIPLAGNAELFNKLDDRFFDCLSSENGGFENAADCYAATQQHG